MDVKLSELMFSYSKTEKKFAKAIGNFKNNKTLEYICCIFLLQRESRNNFRNARNSDGKFVT